MERLHFICCGIKKVLWRSIILTQQKTLLENNTEDDRVRRFYKQTVRIFFLLLCDRERKYVLMHVHVKYQQCLNITSMSNVCSTTCVRYWLRKRYLRAMSMQPKCTTMYRGCVNK